MTEPRIGPGDEAGQPGGSGMNPRAGETSGAGTPGLDPSGERFAGHDEHFADQGQPGTSATGTGSTATRTSASQRTVPQQYGRASDRGTEYERGEDEYGMEPGEDRRPGFGSGGGLISATAGRAWPAVLAGGLGLIAVGIMLLVWPHASLTIVAILIGAALIVSGIVRLIEGFSGHRGEGAGTRAGYVVIGLLAVLAGIYCLRHHAISLFLVAFVTGVYFIVHGISDLGAAFAPGMPARGLRAVLGLFSIAAGILMVVWPGITLVLLLTLVAAWLLFYGLVVCGIAFSLMRLSRAGKQSARGAPRSQVAHA